ncbi:flavohemoglobin expression-modulating QEGLA motif protein [Arsenicicoccus sp. oral taxon 190]|uniref:flavohemoglobin expression-modulating QEGLA motif protein n=1 Tax=Arsenicicoccus sp. oral taxon 190 TaxID=1658671 RepID=UPI00067A4193|nr:tyrosine/phenylalanine carboxypeptidase domain-containing protein [Arsenicicoccus sp. oral taxon 190]AKT50750.1 hypothetical protein ADJ73_04490 [Arsenicicoccus sp. oral taxon 190]
MSPQAPAAGGLAAADLAADHALAQISTDIRFLLDVTPTDAAAVRDRFVTEGGEPEFAYRDLSTDPDVVEQMLRGVDLDAVQDPTLAHLLRAKHREIELQAEMLRARCTDDFLALSLEAYGGVSPWLLATGEKLLTALPPEEDAAPLDAQAFLAVAEAEIGHYRALDPDVDMRVQLRDDVSGVMVEGNALMIPEHARIAVSRADALLQHEVGTHLVTQVNGARQPIRCLGAGLAAYDETQEGLAVLAEIACGGLTVARLRQLGARVVTVHRITSGASFSEAYQGLTEAGVPRASAFTTTMRVYRAGGLTKDAIYLRGLLELLEHVSRGGALDLFFLGKFSLRDLPLVSDLHARGVLAEPLVTPRYLLDPEATDRIARAAAADHLTDLTMEATT